MPESALDVRAMLAGRAALLRDACERGVAYLDGVADRPVAAGRQAVDGLAELAFQLPEHGLSGMQALRLLDEIGSPATVANNGPRYFGFVTGATMANATCLAAARDAC